MAAQMAAVVRMAFLVGLLFLASALRASATGDDRLCDAAAQMASEQTGVPLALLQAVARVESGRGQGHGLQPWPWTVNLAGNGRYLADRQAALSVIESAMADGASNIDIGCFQINLRWHGAAFASPAAMLDPAQNALHAARYLSRLRAKTGSWSAAVGAFHSKRPAVALAYARRVEAMMTRTEGEPPPRPGARAAPGYALLVTGGAGRLGSVLPGDLGGRSPLLAPGGRALP
jgi:hypothetical protein